MKRSIILGAAFVAPALVLAVPAHAATRPTPTPAMVATCDDYRTWYFHRTTAAIDAVMASTFTGAWNTTNARYIMQDAGQLYMDVRTNAASKWVNLDIHYLGVECNKDVLGQ